MNGGEPYPLDFDKIEKGSFISTSEIEAAFGIERSDPSFNFRVLSLRGQIECELRARGTVACIKNGDDGLRVLTDSEALDYVPRVLKTTLRRMAKYNYTLHHVDANRLNSRERERLESETLKSATIVQAIDAARRRLKRLPAGA